LAGVSDGWLTTDTVVTKSSDEIKTKCLRNKLITKVSILPCHHPAVAQIGATVRVPRATATP
jgi:hypothetical protein